MARLESHTLFSLLSDWIGRLQNNTRGSTMPWLMEVFDLTQGQSGCLDVLLLDGVAGEVFEGLDVGKEAGTTSSPVSLASLSALLRT